MKLLQFELHLTGKAESIYEVLSAELKGSYASATRALGERLRPARREALTSAQLLRRQQRAGETVDEYVREFEHLFEKSYGNRSGLDQAFKEVLKRDLFVQGLLLKWQEKVLPSAKTFADAPYQARMIEEQERQLLEIHQRETFGGRNPPLKNIQSSSFSQKNAEKNAERKDEKPVGNQSSSDNRGQ